MRNPTLLHSLREAVAGGCDRVKVWIQQPDVLRQTRAWLSAAGADPRAARIVLAYAYMSCGATQLFHESNPSDAAMRAEVDLFYGTMQDSLAGKEVPAFPAAVLRARRFFRAWAAEDRPRTAESLIGTLGAQSTPQQTAATLALVRAVGGGPSSYRRGLDAAGAVPLGAHVAAVAERALWDVVQEQASVGNFEGVYSLLSELQEAMLALVAHSPRECDQVNDRFDAQFIRQQGEHGCLSTANAQAIVRYLVDTIGGWCAPADDAAIRAWRVRVERGLEASAAWTVGKFVHAFLIPFLAEAFAHVRQLYGRISSAARSARSPGETESTH